MRESNPAAATAGLGSRLARVALPAALVVAAASVGLGVWWMQRGQPVSVAGTDPMPTAGAAADAPDPAEAWLQRARSALQERRLLAPAGDNAVEAYLALLAIDPKHVAARQALLELIPPAAASVQASIAGGEFDEARRQFDLVKRMGAGELTLGSLRTQLAQARAEAEAQAQAEARAEAEATAGAEVQAAARAGPAAIAARVPAPPGPAEVDSPARATPSASAPPAAEPAAVTAANPPAAVSAPVAATPAAPEVQEARQLVDVRPAYPAAARQRRTEGWVELEAAVAADGSVDEVIVVRSEPPRIFDREAVRAAQRWRFEPRRENGVAVASRVRKTVTFRLGAG